MLIETHTPPMWVNEAKAERHAFRISLQSLPKQERKAKWKTFNTEKKAMAQARKVEMQEQRKAERAAFRESLKGLSPKEKQAKRVERRSQSAVNTANRRSNEMEKALAAAASAREFLTTEDVTAACKVQENNRAFKASLKGLSREEKKAKRQARKMEMKAKRQAKCAEFRASLEGLSEEEKKAKRAERHARVRAMRAIRIANRRAGIQTERVVVSVSNLSLDEDKAEATPNTDAAKAPTANKCGIDALVRADMTAFKQSIASLDDEQKKARIQARISKIEANVANFEQKNKPWKLRIARIKLNRTLRLAGLSSEEREAECKVANAATMQDGDKGKGNNKGRGGVAIVRTDMAAFKKSVADLDDAQKHACIETRISELKKKIAKFEEESKPGKLRTARMKLNQTLRFAFFQALIKNGGSKLKPFEKEAAWKAHRALLEMQQDDRGQLSDNEMVLVEEADVKEDSTKQPIAEVDMVVIDEVTPVISSGTDIEKMDLVGTKN